MGRLRQTRSGETVTLGTPCMVGRTSACALRLASDKVSSAHAMLRWSQGRWMVRDLGSTNGTSVDGERLAPGDPRPLRTGAQLDFGGEQRWELMDDGPPVAAAEGQDGFVRRAGEGLLALPHGDAPELLIFTDADGAWLLESEGESRLAVDGEMVEAGGGSWRLAIPPLQELLQTTLTEGAPPLLLGYLTLRFAVSADEEHVQLWLERGDERIDLGVRNHHYMLLTLARQWLADNQAAEAERGWLYMPELCKMLGHDNLLLNAHIYRLRKQLAKAGVDNAGQIIQRRPATQQLRVGTERLVINSGAGSPSRSIRTTHVTERPGR